MYARGGKSRCEHATCVKRCINNYYTYAQVVWKKAAIEISLSLNGFVIRDRRVKNLHEREKKVVAPSELFRSLFPRKCRETITPAFHGNVILVVISWNPRAPRLDLRENTRQKSRPIQFRRCRIIFCKDRRKSHGRRRVKGDARKTASEIEAWYKIRGRFCEREEREGAILSRVIDGASILCCHCKQITVR